MSKVTPLHTTGKTVKGHSYGRNTMHMFEKQVQRGEVVDLDKLAEAMRVSNPQDGNLMDDLDAVIVATKAPGYWGIGKTITEALHNAQFIRPGDSVRVIECGPDAFIDEQGKFHAGESTPYGFFMAEGKVNINYEVITYG